MREVRSFADLKGLVSSWDGKEAPTGAWQAARAKLRLAAQGIAAGMEDRSATAAASKAAAQIAAARLRLVDELGGFLICFEPDTDDLNGRFHRLASDQTPTAHRLQNVFRRLGGYPDWEGHHIADLRDFRANLGPSQVKTRLTGRELDAALADPRWVS
jgi:hypothetical protein